MTEFEQAVRCPGCGVGVEVYLDNTVEGIFSLDPPVIAVYQYCHHCDTPTQEMMCDCGDAYHLTVNIDKTTTGGTFEAHWFCDGCSEEIEGTEGNLTESDCALVFTGRGA
jgi:hypothetical protein